MARKRRATADDEPAELTPEGAREEVAVRGRDVLLLTGAVSRGSEELSDVTPCFTPGTRIATPRGEVPVEKLAAGDWVITRDSGPQQIRWAGRREVSWSELLVNKHLKPVLISRGSLGDGLPRRDMLVSPNHRMLVASDLTQIHFDEHEVFVAAKHLFGAGGVRQIDRAGVTYVHLLFDRHEVIMADGAWTESFQPEDRSLKAMGNAQRSEILELFPELAEEGATAAYIPARRTVRAEIGRLLGH